MPRVFSPPTTQCRIFTKREGVLSAVGHDLELCATRFEIRFDEATNTLDADIDMTSISLEGAVDANGNTDEINSHDSNEIEANLRGQVLRVASFPHARFHAANVSGDPTTVTGELTLLAATRTVNVNVKTVGDEYVATFIVHQPDFGITPFKAMLGALKVAADVRVEVRVPK